MLLEVVAGHEAESEQSSQTRTAHIRVLELERIPRGPGKGQEVGDKRLDEPACLVGEWGTVHEKSETRLAGNAPSGALVWGAAGFHARGGWVGRQPQQAALLQEPRLSAGALRGGFQ